MNFFENYYKRIIRQDLTNKFLFDSNKDIPKLKKITLNFGCTNLSIQKFAVTMLALEIITLKKGTITTTRKPNVILKIQKGQPAGCKVELKNSQIYSFITRLNIEILPKLKNFHKFRLNNQQFNAFFQIPGNDIILKEFESHYPLFSNLPTLDINILTNTKKDKEILYLAKSIKLPFYKKLK
jgi:large subunit ribosomal protein L5